MVNEEGMWQWAYQHIKISAHLSFEDEVLSHTCLDGCIDTAGLLSWRCGSRFASRWRYRAVHVSAFCGYWAQNWAVQRCEGEFEIEGCIVWLYALQISPNKVSFIFRLDICISISTHVLPPSSRAAADSRGVIASWCQMIWWWESPDLSKGTWTLNAPCLFVQKRPLYAEGCGTLKEQPFLLIAQDGRRELGGPNGRFPQLGAALGQCTSSGVAAYVPAPALPWVAMRSWQPWRTWPQRRPMRTGRHCQRWTWVEKLRISGHLDVFRCPCCDSKW